jgi:hypothetical protein
MKKANGLKRTMLIYFLSIGFTALLSTQAFGQVNKITINQLLESLDNRQLLIVSAIFLIKINKGEIRTANPTLSANAKRFNL